MFKILKMVGRVFLSSIAAVFQAIVTVSWGIAGFLLLLNFIQQYKLSPEPISTLLTTQQFIIQNSAWFALAFVAFYFWQNFNSLKEKEGNKWQRKMIK